MATSDERAALFALLKVRPGGMSWPEIATEVAYAGSATAVWDERVMDGLLPSPDAEAAWAAAIRELDAWQAAGLNLVTVLDDDYPQRLLDIRETPPFLFAAGSLLREDSGMSVVGSRHASERGLQIAAEAARLLVAKRMTVIAGLAAGIDAAAHRAALEAGGRTVAMIGTGINKFYPTTNQELQREIADRGLVLSQFFPDASPTKHNFPMRNATMSGYGQATIVVEAGETSGTRIQARLAVQHGRPVILTDSVAAGTRWGALLSERPGVHVAAGMSELNDVIERVSADQGALKDALRDLAESAA